ncbi:MAG: hypothetical protein ACE5KC_02820 [Candidatus Bathyarchaeia archaeon]
MKKKKTIDYINELRFGSDQEECMLGEELLRQYQRWNRSLRLRDILYFLNFIQNKKEKIGAAQFFGKFRACSFEEFIYRLLKTKLDITRRLQVFWGEKCLIWKRNSQRYGIEVDIAIGRKLDEFVEPAVAIDAKVELDSARLKTALASMLLVKRLNQQTKCFIVYIRREVSNPLLNAANTWVDGIFQFGPERNEITNFLKSAQKATLLA